MQSREIVYELAALVFLQPQEKTPAASRSAAGRSAIEVARPTAHLQVALMALFYQQICLVRSIRGN
jgi:hypothetical protein